jgi:hypothetical protein
VLSEEQIARNFWLRVHFHAKTRGSFGMYMLPSLNHQNKKKVKNKEKKD